VKIGFVPAIVMAFLRRSLREKRVFEVFATGESIDAGEAHAMGLFNRVYPNSDFAASVDAYVQGLAEKSPSALSRMKNLLHQTDGMTLDKAIESGVHGNALARMTDDARHGFERFLKKS
jgi:methylglutaconyl-CoA hydratase